MNRPAHIDIGPAEAPPAMIHHLLTIAPADRVDVVAALAGGSGRSLVFTRTKHAARRLARQLTAGGIPAAELHGDLAQGARERNLASFADGVVRVIVATDVAARGIHVDGVDLVIHADPPTEHKAYLHRSGRTARAGAAGTVITLQVPAQAADVRTLMRKAGVVPLTAPVTAGSPLLRSIAGERVAPVTLPPARPAAVIAAPATGRGAAAMSAGFRGRRDR
jgi:superfamily II DNA/RNA helicase